MAVDGYRLEAVAGQGGTSTVYRGRGTGRKGELVALKRLRRAGDPQVAERLRREAATLASLTHPHVVRVLDVVADGSGSAMVMEYAAGGSLATMLARRGRLRPEEALAVALPLADALTAVHHRGLVHGDVKPANVVFTSAGAPILVDFGVTTPGAAAMATTGYVDPAVAHGGVADERSDVYGLGAVCHEMLCGRPPCRRGGRRRETLGPPELQAVVARALARRPADRFPDMAAMGAALRAASANLPVPPVLPVRHLTQGSGSSPDVAGPPTRPLGPRAHRDGGPAPARRSSRRRRRLTVGVVVASVVMATGASGAALAHLLPRLGDGPVRPRPQTCAPVTSAMRADLDGDGCPSVVTVRENVLEIEGERYQLGRPGDIVVVGDWDCDGRDTPALYRPSGEVHLFDGWASGGEALPAASRGEVLENGVPEVRRGEDGCDHLVVR